MLCPAAVFVVFVAVFGGNMWDCYNYTPECLYWGRLRTLQNLAIQKELLRRKSKAIFFFTKKVELKIVKLNCHEAKLLIEKKLLFL